MRRCSLLFLFCVVVRHRWVLALGGRCVLLCVFFSGALVRCVSHVDVQCVVLVVCCFWCWLLVGVRLLLFVDVC